MSFRLRFSALTLLLCLVGAGCSPIAETQLDEQKNPHYQAGKKRLSGLDHKGAIESFERATEDNPRSALAHYELGVLFDQNENDYAAALYHYNKALKLRPSGYPADNIRLRIPACKQELVKADSLAVINPNALRETERLREENLALRKQVEQLQAHLATRPAQPAPLAGVAGPEPPFRSSVPASSGSFPPVPARLDQASGFPTSGSASSERLRTPISARSRTHSVKAGDTPFSIARQYQVKLPSLFSANPGLDPKKMRVGQVLQIPSS